MNIAAACLQPAPHVPLRVLTATALFDGHDAAINQATILERCGVERVYDSEEGRRIGLVGMAQDLLRRAASAVDCGPDDGEEWTNGDRRLGWLISTLEWHAANTRARCPRKGLRQQNTRTVPVIGITGVGGAGTSSLLEEPLLRWQGFDLVFVETAGIGQGESDIVDLADCSLYVRTADFGAPTQLEKIDMLEQADLVAVNKSDRWGAADALLEVRQEWRRSHHAYGMPRKT